MFVSLATGMTCSLNVMLAGLRLYFAVCVVVVVTFPSITQYRQLYIGRCISQVERIFKEVSKHGA